MFVIDSDALIQAFRYDFPPLLNPGGFWDWLGEMHSEGRIVISEAVFDEIQGHTDGLYDLLYKEHSIPKEPKANALRHMRRVMDAYGVVTEVDLEYMNSIADPYLVAHALQLNGTVVTNEASRPGATSPMKKKIPDICSTLGVACVRYPRFLWDMRGGE